MACYHHITNDGIVIHMCGDLGQHCADCADVSVNLCDYPVGIEKTCDRYMCDAHSNIIGHDVHYCADHYHMWLDFEKSGGVKEKLKNVVPFQNKL